MWIQASGKRDAYDVAKKEFEKKNEICAELERKAKEERENFAECIADEVMGNLKKRFPQLQ